MANEKENKGTAMEEPKENNEQKEVTVTTPKTGIGTALKIGGALLFGAAMTGLGWLLRGVFGGGTEENETEAAEAEHPEE